MNAEFRTMIQNLQRQLEHQRIDFEQQRKDARDRETTLVAHLEQQRKELVQLVKRQNDRLKE